MPFFPDYVLTRRPDHICQHRKEMLGWDPPAPKGTNRLLCPATTRFKPTAARLCPPLTGHVLVESRCVVETTKWATRSSIPGLLETTQPPVACSIHIYHQRSIDIIWCGRADVTDSPNFKEHYLIGVWFLLHWHVTNGNAPRRNGCDNKRYRAWKLNERHLK